MGDAFWRSWGSRDCPFLGDIPDADRWLDYVLRCYLTVYPFWGGDEGGWAQGTELLVRVCILVNRLRRGVAGSDRRRSFSPAFLPTTPAILLSISSPLRASEEPSAMAATTAPARSPRF